MELPLDASQQGLDLCHYSHMLDLDALTTSVVNTTSNNGEGEDKKKRVKGCNLFSVRFSTRQYDNYYTDMVNVEIR